jgi:predicted phage terminase large subunit-like protein
MDYRDQLNALKAQLAAAEGGPAKRSWIPIVPTERQAEFLARNEREVFFGGSAGGGKSSTLLAAALQHVDTPGYAALILRRSFADLNLPGSLIPRSHEWLRDTDAWWENVLHQWKFPSGATLTFGYLQDEADKYRYQSSEFQYVAFDELSQFTESQYLYLFSRLRRLGASNVPQRMRSASNPGGIGHAWVKNRFIDNATPDRRFIPAKLTDNPHLDQAGYIESLSQLDPVTRAQLLHGDWSIRPEGNLFRREWFGVPVINIPPIKRVVRGWDFAATAEGQGGDPDYTAGAKLGLADDGTVYVLHVVRDRLSPQGVESLVKSLAATDSRACVVRLEQEPGSAGKALAEHYQRQVIPGFSCIAKPATGDKITRSGPFSAAVEQRRVKLVAGPWNEAFLDELCAFPAVRHDDQVDAAVNAFNELTGDTVEFSFDFSMTTLAGAGQRQRY